MQRDKNHHTRKSLPRSGRPPAISDRTRRTVLRDLRTHRFQPYKQIAAGIHGVNERQVRDIAHAAGYHRRVARRKPFLSARAVKKRLEWAKENEDRESYERVAQRCHAIAQLVFLTRNMPHIYSY